MTGKSRKIHEIAQDISTNWQKVNYAAKPYLDAMHTLSDINDKYYLDSADSILRYFLSNASSWRGEKAREIKAEIKALLAN